MNLNRTWNAAPRVKPTVHLYRVPTRTAPAPVEPAHRELVHPLEHATVVAELRHAAAAINLTPVHPDDEAPFYAQCGDLIVEALGGEGTPVTTSRLSEAARQWAQHLAERITP